MSAEVSSKEPITEGKEEIFCGIVMPISPIDGCSAEHWNEVKTIIFDTVKSIASKNFKPSLVSDGDEVGVIQKRIVQGLYDAEVVICDVSGKNPNVMFELGMRLAFDKPTVIIKDDKTDYAFDTGVIEHISYPRDLRFSKIMEFKKNLAKKVELTHAKGEKSETSFLKNFGKFQVAKLDEQTVSSDVVIMEKLSELQRDMSLLKRDPSRRISRAKGLSRIKMQIRQAYTAWKNYNPDTTISNCTGNEDFYDFIDERVRDAPEYFDSREEFLEYIDNVLFNV